MRWNRLKRLPVCYNIRSLRPFEASIPQECRRFLLSMKFTSLMALSKIGSLINFHLPAGTRPKEKSRPQYIVAGLNYHQNWSGRGDLNPGPPEPHSKMLHGVFLFNYMKLNVYFDFLIVIPLCAWRAWRA